MQWDKTQNLLNRMKRAYWKNKGVRISAEELQQLALTSFGEMWEQEDPRHSSGKSSGREYTPRQIVKRIKKTGEIIVLGGPIQPLV